MTDDVPLPPTPAAAQVVGTVTFSASEQYRNPAAFDRDRARHRIKKGGKPYDWTGAGEMHAWHVGGTRRFQVPVSAGTKSMTGSAAKTLDVMLASASAGEGSAS